MVPARESAPVPERRPSRRRPERADNGATEDTSDAELRIIDIARTATAQNHPRDALAAIQRHRREFPRGQFVEEREALRVIATHRLGQSARAQELLEHFEQTYPRSLLLPAVRRALRQE